MLTTPVAFFIFNRPDLTGRVFAEIARTSVAYDAESLLLLLRKAGFSRAVEQRFGESLHPRMKSIDTEARAFESLYVEGVK